VHNPTGDAGQPYVHDTTGDHGPYYYWKLRQQAKAGAAAPTQPAQSAAPAPKRQIVTVRKQRPSPAQPPVFANFQAAPAPAAPARQPARQQFFQPAPAPARQAPAPTNFFQPQAPAYQVDFNARAYAYTAPTYSAQAQGTSYSYEAQY